MNKQSRMSGHGAGLVDAGGSNHIPGAAAQRNRSHSRAGRVGGVRLRADRTLANGWLSGAAARSLAKQFSQRESLEYQVRLTPFVDDANMRIVNASQARVPGPAAFIEQQVM